MVNKSVEYHYILDCLERGENLVAAFALQEYAPRLSSLEFRLIINAFVRRNIQLVTT